MTGDENDLSVRLSVNIAYGYEIPKICQQIQEKVKSAVENMTGLQVVAVDVKIAAVSVANE